MLTGLLVAAGVIVAGSVAFVASRPSEFRVARTATIDSPVPVVFAQVNDFHRWAAWSPYERRDPAMRKTYEGAPAGTGAIYSWAGNKEVGEGRSIITESRPNELIRIRLEFARPFKATSTAEFTFRPEGRPEGDRTAVTWSLTGRNSFMVKAICMFMDMDRMIGGDFEQGLAQMKSVVDAASRS